MRRTARSARWKPGAALAVLVALGAVAATGCGNGEPRRNALRPPLPIVVSVSIDDRAVHLSPQRIGAGPITLLISNVSGEAQQVTLETTNEPGADTPGLRAVETGPISPNETASVQAQVEPDRSYTLSVSGGGIRPARIDVGATRASPQNVLRTP